MILSMTGYGSAAVESDALRASVAIRALNHRHFDLSLHVSRRLAALEPELKELVQSRVQRGRIELSLQASVPEAAAVAVTPVKPLVAGVVHALRQLQAEHGLEGGVTVADIARFPGTLETVEGSLVLGGDAHDALLALVARGLDGLLAMRRQEGERLEAELLRRLDAIGAGVDDMESQAGASREARRQALADKVRAVVDGLGLDDARLYQEVVRTVERHDVSEEVQRLRSHVDLGRELVQGKAPCGKRLDFVAQEMAREANTLGSKAGAAVAVQLVVALKNEIEKLREQVQNVE
jgi:uncharacterized protein (TIGR00255 family)